MTGLPHANSSCHPAIVAKTIEAFAKELSLLLDSARYVPGHQVSLWSRLQLRLHRLIFRIATRSLCASLQNEHSRALVSRFVVQPPKGWAESDLLALESHSRRFIVSRSNEPVELISFFLNAPTAYARPVPSKQERAAS